MNDFGVVDDSLGDARRFSAISVSDYLVKQELTVLRVRIELERGQVFNSAGKVAASTARVSKALHIISCGSENNIEPSTMERDTKDFINGLSEEKFGTSDPALQYLMVDTLH